MLNMKYQVKGLDIVVDLREPHAYMDHDLLDRIEAFVYAIANYNHVFVRIVSDKGEDRDES